MCSSNGCAGTAACSIVQAQLQQRLLMKERLEKRTLPAHALACCCYGLGHGLIIVVVVGVCTSTTSGSWGA